MAALELHVDLAPGVVDLVAPPHQAVVHAGDDDPRDDDDHDDDDDARSPRAPFVGCALHRVLVYATGGQQTCTAIVPALPACSILRR